MPPAHDMDDPRRLPMFTGEGHAMNWNDLLNALDWAEIIIIGEQHDDAMGHAFQLAVTEDTLARWPRAMLSMEMLERDHQMLVDDYLEGYITQEFFVRRAGIARWGGREGSWDDWFQPIVDAAKDASAPVIAANAPRRYVRLARTHGYGYLRRMSRERREMFDIPPRVPCGTYRARFYDVMLSMRDHSTDDDNDDDGNGNGVMPGPADQHPVQDDVIDAMFRSQLVWDATMARSIVRARPTRERKVIHLVGRFHMDFEGGLVMELRRLRPGSHILTISMSPIDAAHLGDEDAGRADIVIYTGEQSADDGVDRIEGEEEEVGEAEDGEGGEHEDDGNHDTDSGAAAATPPHHP